jgi:hypothetical protein
VEEISITPQANKETTVLKTNYSLDEIGKVQARACM